MLAYLPAGRIIVIVLMPVDAVGVDQNVVMIVRLVDVGRNHDLHVVPERLSDKRAAHAVNKFRRKVRIRLERLDVMNCFHSTLTDCRQRFIKLVVSVILVDVFHVKICVLGICEAVQGIAQK